MKKISKKEVKKLRKKTEIKINQDCVLKNNLIKNSKKLCQIQKIN